MSPSEAVGLALVVGCGFYGAGTVGLLRFPDVYSRLHALTKADNQGLFFVVLGLGLLAGHWRVAFLLIVIWLVGIMSAAVSAYLIARPARRSGQRQASRTARP